MKDIKNKHPFVQLLLFIIISIASVLLISLAGIVIAMPFWGIDSVNWSLNMNDLAFTASHIGYFKFQQVISQIGMLGLPAILFTYLFQKDTFFANKERVILKNAGLAICLLIAVYPLIDILSTINQKIPFPDFVYQMEDKTSEFIKLFLADKSVIAFITNVLVIALCAAVCEEFAFRGVVLRIFLQWTKSIHWAVIISALIFSFIHFQFLGFFARFILGMVLGYTFVYTKSIWAAVLIHFINNFMALVLSLFMGDTALYEQVFTIDIIGTLAALTSLIVSILICYLMNKNYNKIKITNYIEE